MALQSSGPIKISEIADEFTTLAGSTPDALSEFYGAADGVPSSGPIDMSDFYGASAVVAYTASNATNVSLSTVFGTAWSGAVTKTYTIPSGVEIGATASNYNALTVESGMGGTLTISVVGTVSGAGGAKGDGGDDGRNTNSVAGDDGGDGGTAIEILSNNVTLVNTGTIRGGGGGGGGGGEGMSSYYTSNPGALYAHGGAGGDGGRGEGYNQTRTNGSSGGAVSYQDFGTTIFGNNGGNRSGGTGGNGGTYGNNGTNGNTGNNGSLDDHEQFGNYTMGSGASGGSGGLAGYSVKKGSGITVTQSGGGTQVGRTN